MTTIFSNQDFLSLSVLMFLVNGNSNANAHKKKDYWYCDRCSPLQNNTAVLESCTVTTQNLCIDGSKNSVNLSVQTFSSYNLVLISASASCLSLSRCLMLYVLVLK